ncbi:ABC transporter permease [Paracoccus cavernae]|uniref:ABC transporter permease n=1 Tax=Paracoccus cavernae TaxID=1571207 RepID=A0ABT8DCD3_9RHOB|nr:ABC transporter permease [Paracoccus cavernae]
MVYFILTRLLRALLTLLLVMTFAFFVLRLSGDPAVILLGPDAPQDSIDAFRERWGLNDPLWQQYLAYLLQLAQFDFGVSMRDQVPAIDLVLSRIPATLAITLPALILKVGIGIPAGVYAALHRQSVADRSVIGLSIFGFTIPSFVMGLLLVLIFSVSLGWLARAAKTAGDTRSFPSSPCPSAGSGSWRGSHARR